MTFLRALVLMMDARPVGLSAGDGEKKVYVYLKDLAGNITEANAGEITVHVDTQAPVPGSLVITGRTRRASPAPA